MASAEADGIHRSMAGRWPLASGAQGLLLLAALLAALWERSLPATDLMPFRTFGFCRSLPAFEASFLLVPMFSGCFGHGLNCDKHVLASPDGTVCLTRTTSPSGTGPSASD